MGATEEESWDSSEDMMDLHHYLSLVLGVCTYLTIGVVFIAILKGKVFSQTTKDEAWLGLCVILWPLVAIWIWGLFNTFMLGNLVSTLARKLWKTPIPPEIPPETIPWQQRGH